MTHMENIVYVLYNHPSLSWLHFTAHCGKVLCFYAMSRKINFPHMTVLHSTYLLLVHIYNPHTRNSFTMTVVIFSIILEKLG